jgi:hypothetical protein
MYSITVKLSPRMQGREEFAISEALNFIIFSREPQKVFNRWMRIENIFKYSRLQDVIHLIDVRKYGKQLSKGTNDPKNVWWKSLTKLQSYHLPGHPNWGYGFCSRSGLFLKQIIWKMFNIF